jgi:hypothetical protein
MPRDVERGNSGLALLDLEPSFAALRNPHDDNLVRLVILIIPYPF